MSAPIVNPEPVDGELDPFKLIASFDRCQNYPRTDQGISALAEGLERASDAHHVPMKEIVEKCLSLSKYCPTDYDLLCVAREMREDAERKQQPDQIEVWEREYGKPKPMPVSQFLGLDRARNQDAEMWRRLRDHLKVRDGKWPPWSEVYAAADQLGFGLTASQKSMMGGEAQ